MLVTSGPSFFTGPALGSGSMSVLLEGIQTSSQSGAPKIHPSKISISGLLLVTARSVGLAAARLVGRSSTITLRRKDILKAMIPRIAAHIINIPRIILSGLMRLDDARGGRFMRHAKFDKFTFDFLVNSR